MRDLFKFVLVLVLSLLLTIWLYVFSFGCVGVDCVKDSNVFDSNDGKAGDILAYCGEKGNDSIGIWTDPKDITALRGEDGSDGYTPIKGVDYFDGVDGVGMDGINGYTPVKGIDYFDGLNGKDGVGKDGANGSDGKDGVGKDGTDGKTPIKNVDYFDGLNGINGTNGKDVDPKLVNALTEKNNEQDNRINSVEKQVKGLSQTQYNIRTELKFIRQKHLEMGIYGVYNTNRRICSEVGINVVIPVGEGYQDRENKRINRRLSNIEKQISNAVVLEKVIDKSGKVLSMGISSLKVEKSF